MEVAVTCQNITWAHRIVAAIAHSLWYDTPANLRSTRSSLFSTTFGNHVSSPTPPKISDTFLTPPRYSKSKVTSLAHCSAHSNATQQHRSPCWNWVSHHSSSDKPNNQSLFTSATQSYTHTSYLHTYTPYAVNAEQHSPTLDTQYKTELKKPTICCVFSPHTQDRQFCLCQ